MRRPVLFCAPLIAGLALMGAAVPGASAAAPVDYSVRATDTSLDVGAGNAVGTGFDVHAPGRAAATLTITVPSGLSLIAKSLRNSSTGKRLVCTGTAASVNCRVPAGTDAEYSVGISAATTAAPGTVRQLTAQLAPSGTTDTNPKDNTAAVRVTVVASARVGFDLTAPAVGFHTTKVAAGTVRAGVQTHFVCSATSHGPDTVTGITAVLTFFDPQGGTWDVRSTPTGTPFASPNGGGYFTRDVPVGTLRPSETVSFDIYVTGGSPGADGNLQCTLSARNYQSLQLVAIDRAGNTGALARLTVAAASVPTSRVPSPSGTSTALADTGVAASSLGGWALALVLSGAGLTLLGRRRRSGTHS